MDLSSLLLAVIVFLGTTALCVILFERLGFIVAGIIIGPHTPGPVPFQNVDELQNVAEIGVVLFLFAVALEMRPDKVWVMRRIREAVNTSITEVMYFCRQQYRAQQARLSRNFGVYPPVGDSSRLVHRSLC